MCLSLESGSERLVGEHFHAGGGIFWIEGIGSGDVGVDHLNLVAVAGMIRCRIIKQRRCGRRYCQANCAAIRRDT